MKIALFLLYINILKSIHKKALGQVKSQDQGQFKWQGQKDLNPRHYQLSYTPIFNDLLIISPSV